MERRQRRLPGLALPTISCMWVRVSHRRRRCCCCCCGTDLAFLPLLGFTTFSFPPPLPFPSPPFPFCTSPSSSLSSFALCFLALAAPASAVDGARLRALGDERLRPLRVAVTVDLVACIEGGVVWCAVVVVVVVVGCGQIERGTGSSLFRLTRPGPSRREYFTPYLSNPSMAN
jgi:hypothetical protein